MPREFKIRRSLISVATDIEVAKRFADGGRLYGGLMPEFELTRQALDGAGESEYLIRNMTDRLKLIGGDEQ